MTITRLLRRSLKAQNIWNCDESGFSHDPSKCLSVTVKGKVAYKVTCGSRRENTTTLAVVSAAGRVLDPLISRFPILAPVGSNPRLKYVNEATDVKI